MKVYLARHGQTVWNRRDVVCGRTDIPLTEKGLQQARELAEQVAAAPVDLILASPLQRAQQTAQVVAERIHAPIVTEPLLLEQDFGDYEEVGRFDEKYMAYRKDFFRPFPGGGESIAMVTARAERDHIDNTCRCCKFRWQTLPLRQLRIVPTPNTTEDSE